MEIPVSSGRTVIVISSVFPSALTVIVAVPALTAVNVLPLTEITSGSLDVIV